MTKEEFLKNYDLEDDLNKFLDEGHNNIERDSMWFYCLFDGNTGLSLCHFFDDSMEHDVVDFEEFAFRDLDTVEKWRDLMLENDFILPEGVNIWWEGTDQFVEYLEREYRFDPPPMYEPEWVPDVYEYIELEENEKEK